jgi:DNA-binding beta-propeller fold protein YncE
MILVGWALSATVFTSQATSGASAAAPAAAQVLLKLDHSIPLTGVKGRIDHLALDAQRDRLYLAALANDTIEVVDLQTKKRARSLSGASEPQGVLYLEAFDVLVVANGGNGMLEVFDGDTLEKRSSSYVGEDADNLRYDAVAQQVFVAYGRGAVGILDAATWKPLAQMKVAAHPEAFALDPHSSRVFVNVPSERSIAVLDRSTRATSAVWPVASAQANYPMALLGADERLLVGCRNPPKLLVYDTKSGKESAALDLSGDVDDIFFDAERARVYASCGAGFIDVFERTSPGVLAPAGKVATRGGARTSLFVPERKRLYLAVPEHGGEPAEVRVFDVVP